MRLTITRVLLACCTTTLIACGGKKKISPEPDPIGKDTVTAMKNNPTQPATVAEDSTLTPVRAYFEKGLDKWAASFRNFHIDSFRMNQKSNFADVDYREEEPDLNKFYALYKPALVFSPDSSSFIDMYSAGLMLEKKGRKIIASADVDQAVTLCNLSAKTWKGIAYFGPSAWIEEAVWTSPSTFILAGIMVSEENENKAMIMLGDINKRSFRWFESNAVRAQSVNYEASGMKKLKIDEWE